MGGLCGWAGHTADEESRRNLLARMAGVLSRRDAGDVSTRCSIGCAVGATSRGGSVLQENLLLVAITGRPVWNDRALADIAAEKGDAHALVAAYAAKGSRLLDVLGGRFALAVVREGDWEVLLAVDHFGSIPVDYSFRHGCLVFGTDGEALRVHPRAESEIDPQALFGYFFHSAVAAPGTARKNHRRLLPGHRLVLKGGRIEVDAYFQPEWGEDRRPLDELKEELTAHLRAAVEAAAVDGAGLLEGRTGAPAVAAMLGESARTYNAVFEGEGAVTPDDLLEAVPRIAEIHTDPFADEAAVRAYFAARRAAADGAPRLLSVAGGDVLLGAHAAPRRAVLSSIVRRFSRRAREAEVLLPSRLHAESLVVRLGARSIFTPEFLKTVDTEASMRLVRHIWSQARTEREECRRMVHDIKYVLADRDLPAVTRSCGLAGLDVAYPFLTDEIAAFAARLPANLRGRLLCPMSPRPPVPLSAWLQTHRGMQQLAGESLSDLKQRSIVRPAFVDEVVRMHRTEEGPYHARMAWRMIMLEQWFRAHEREPAQVI